MNPKTKERTKRRMRLVAGGGGQAWEAREQSEERTEGQAEREAVPGARLLSSSGAALRVQPKAVRPSPIAFIT
jgi:hypothetical protein